MVVVIFRRTAGVGSTLCGQPDGKSASNPAHRGIVDILRVRSFDLFSGLDDPLISPEDDQHSDNEQYRCEREPSMRWSLKAEEGPFDDHPDSVQ